mmetsp:Transcript_10143/g.37748  ORF Transcript_10143/g.37748 Transcript_10143/m.37748 type:complete len:1610 (-) Transcript_10143:430-5259(-)|eukprot:CAMPEP_0117454248 /NCGR_PEP_ID=MMETSP0759-20121206/10699_1 /TAXON_ID=63605 /ORGANISM="Percolomonas cosmopolitus, Strain WS" /LENGTH=1609 /DNA_ID=CAMNT_0005247421 /DNA_START=71 /DNA_END=4900 /DNA_ORIENTATION=-
MTYHSVNHRYSPRKTLHDVEKLSEALGYPDIHYPSKLKNPECQFNGELASKGYVSSLAVSDPYGSFGHNQATDLTQKFYDAIHRKKNSLMHTWSSYTTQKTTEELHQKFNVARQIAACAEARMPAIQSNSSNHSSAKQDWLLQLQDSHSTVSLNDLAKRFPHAGFNDSSLFDDLYASKIPIPKSVWLIKLNLNIQHKSSLSSPHLQLQHQKHCSQKWTKALRENALEPLFKKNPVDLEKTRYFIQLLFYCAEERLLDVEVFEEWFLSQKTLLHALLEHMFHLTMASVNGGGGETTSVALAQNITPEFIIQQLALKRQTDSSSDQNLTIFIIQQFKLAIHLSSTLPSSDSNYLHNQQRQVLKAIIGLVENYSQSLPPFCERLSSIPCGGKITHHLLKLVSNDNSLHSTDVSLETDQYSEMSIIKHLDVFLTHGNSEKLFSILFSHERRYAQSIDLLCKWACFGGNGGSGKYDPMRIYVCTFLLEELNTFLMKKTERRRKNGSSTLSNGVFLHTNGTKSTDSPSMAKLHSQRNHSIDSPRAKPLSTNNKTAGRHHPSFSALPKHSSNSSGLTTPPLYSQGSPRAPQEFPLQSFLHTVLIECENATHNFASSWGNDATGTVFRNFFKLFAELEERGLFSYEQYTNWLIRENKLPFSSTGGKSHNEDSFNFQFLRNMPIFSRSNLRDQSDDDDSSEDDIDEYNVMPNEVRIRQTFLQRMGINFTQDDEQIIALIGKFPRLFDTSHLEDDLLLQIKKMPLYCQFALTRHIRGLFIQHFVTEQQGLSASDTATERYLHHVFALMHMVEDYRSLQLIIMALCHAIGEEDVDPRAPQLTSTLQSFIISYFLNRFDLFICMDAAPVYLDIFWRVASKRVHHQYLVKCLNSLEYRFSFFTRREEITKLASPHSASLVKEFNSSQAGGGTKSASFSRLAEALRTLSGDYNTHQVLIDQIATQIIGKDRSIVPFGKDQLHAALSRCLQLTSSSDSSSEGAVINLLQFCRFSMLRGSFLVVDVSNAFISLIAMVLTTAQSHHDLQPLICLLHYSIGLSLLTADTLVNNIVHPLTDLIKLDVNTASGNNLEIEKVLQHYQWFLNDLVFKVRLNQGAERFSQADSRKANGGSNIHSAVARSIHVLCYSQINCYSVRYLPKFVKSLLDICAQAKTHEKMRVHEITVSLLKQFVSSCFVLSRLTCVTHYVTKCLDSIDHCAALDEDQKAEILGTILQSVVPQEYSAIHPLVSCPLDTFIDYVSNETDKWNGWMNASILHIYLRRNIRTHQTLSSEVCNKLIDCIPKATDKDLYTFLLTYQCEADPDSSVSLKKVLFSKFKSILKDCNDRETWKQQLDKVAFCSVENCRTDANLADAMGESLSNMLRECAELSKRAVLFPHQNAMLADGATAATSGDSSSVQNGIHPTLDVLQDRAITCLKIISKIISYQSKVKTVVRTVKCLVSLFNNRLAQVESLSVMRNRDHISIRNYVFGIVQLIENHPHLRFSVKNVVSSNAPLGEIESSAQNGEESQVIQLPRTMNDLKNKFLDNPWLAIEELTQRCEACHQDHTRFYPSHQKFHSKVVERGGLFYGKNLKKRSRELTSNGKSVGDDGSSRYRKRMKIEST